MSRATRPQGSLCACVALVLAAVACNGSHLSPLPDGGHRATPDAEQGFPDVGSTPRLALALHAVEPARGPFTGGNLVLLPVSGFARAPDGDACVDCEVTFDGSPANGVRLVDAHHLEVVAPPGLPGPADVRVAQAGAEAVRTDGYTYEALAVHPARGSTTGGTWVTVETAHDVFAGAAPVVRFAGDLCDRASVVSARRLTCFTPRGELGPATVTVTMTDGEPLAVPNAYRYEDPTLAGFGPGGGPLDGTLEVSVLEWGRPLAGAIVLAGPSLDGLMRTATDERGLATLSGPAMRGAVELHVGAPCHSPVSLLRFDARRATVELARRPSCTSPPTGGRYGAFVSGSLDVAGWAGVPRVPGEQRVVRIMTTSLWTTGVDASLGGRDRVIEGDESAGYRVFSRPGLVAVVALAGTEAPSGAFTAWRMGIARGVLLASSEERVDVPLRLDIPLDQRLRAELTPPGGGEVELTATLRLEEGYVPRAQSVRGAPPRLEIAEQPALTGILADGRFDVSATHYSPEAGLGGVGTTARYFRGVGVLDLVIDDFLPAPTCLAPMDTLFEQQLGWETGGGAASYTMVTLRADDLVWTIFGPGDLTDAALPTLVDLGIEPVTPDQIGSWSVQRLVVTGTAWDRLGDAPSIYADVTHQATCWGRARW